jgi:hypothetical protein
VLNIGSTVFVPLVNPVIAMLIPVPSGAANVRPAVFNVTIKVWIPGIGPVPITYRVELPDVSLWLILPGYNWTVRETGLIVPERKARETLEVIQA